MVIADDIDMMRLHNIADGFTDEQVALWNANLANIGLNPISFARLGGTLTMVGSSPLFFTE